MLTQEQERVLEKACALFLDAKQQEKENTVSALTLYNNAFGMLADYIDDVDDIYYRLVFANCIERMQRKGNFEFEDILIQAKVDIYAKTLQWFLSASQYNTAFHGHLVVAFDALWRLFLLGEDYIRQDDGYAYVCGQCLKMLNIPMVDEVYLQDFVQDEKTGQWRFVGVKPQ